MALNHDDVQNAVVQHTKTGAGHLTTSYNHDDERRNGGLSLQFTEGNK